MTVEEYNELEPIPKLIATVHALVQDNDGEILLTSGKLKAVTGRNELVWEHGLETPKIVRIRSEFRRPEVSGPSVLGGG